MRYLVTSECVDRRTGKRFMPQDEFLPEPDAGQAARLIHAGCLEILSERAPEIPEDELDGKSVTELREIAKAEEVDLGHAKKADAIVDLIRTKRSSAPVDLKTLDHAALVKVAAAEQVEIAGEAEAEVIRKAIAEKRAQG